jgi:glycosyltransferase involved in cell wall biosynthesis
VKVAFVASASSWHTYRWYKSLRDKIDIDVFTFNRGIADYGEDQHVFAEWMPQKLKYLLGVGGMKKAIREFNPDILHAHYATGHGYVGSRLDVHPFVVSVWGSDIFDFPHKNRRVKKFLGNILAKADAVCATSGILRDETLRLFPDLEPKINVIPFGIDLDLFKPYNRGNKPGNIVIGTAKIFTEIYQLDMLMKIFDELAGQVEGLVLKLAGYGPDEQKLLALKNELKHGRQIEFAGHIPNDKMPEFLNSLDIFVLPSRFESFGVSALEASACGLPVVAYRVGGLSEIVQDKLTGYLVPEDNPDQLEKATKELALDKARRLEMGKAGREFAVRNFNIEKTTEKQIKLYESLL